MLDIFAEAGGKSNKHMKYQFWQASYHPVELSDNKITDQKLEYLHYNPVKAGIVESPEYYKFSSASDYYCEFPGIIDLIFLE